MVSEPHTRPPPVDDLEDTQELPMLDLEAYEAGFEANDAAAADAGEVTLIQPRPVPADGLPAADFAAVEAEVAALGSDVERLRSLLAEREAELGAARRELALGLQRASDAEAARAAAEARLAAASAEVEVGREERTGLWRQQESLESELRSAQAVVEELNAAVAGQAAQIASMNSRVDAAERAAVWAGADSQSLRAQLAAAHEALRSRETRRGIWESVWREADAALAASSLAGGELSVRLQQAESRIAATEGELAASRRETQEARAALEQARAAAAAAAEQARRADEELIVLRAALAESQRRAERVEGELQEARGAGEGLGAALAVARESLLGSERRLAEVESGAATREAGLRARLAETEALVHRLEIELVAKTARIEALSTLETVRGAERPQADGARPAAPPAADAAVEAIAEAATGAKAERGAVHVARREPDLLPEGAPRFLILSEGNAETVFRLGRRTTIGRAEDNDISLGRSSISRHHAVVHSGPRQTVIEDLNSTNGILVNRRRVRETVLRDGDVVHIGKCKFRFSHRLRGTAEAT